VAVTAERSFLVELGGDCNLPAGAHAVADADGKLTIRGVLAAGDGRNLQRAEIIDLPGADPGRSLARRLRAALAADPGPGSAPHP
ncbi:MAG: hypothetical protein R2761_30850, partial [Acidimicrobiales bacterium]